MGKSHSFPPPAPIGNEVCCWPRCSKPRSNEFVEWEVLREESFPLCTGHVQGVYALKRAEVDQILALKAEVIGDIVPTKRGVRVQDRTDVGWIYYLKFDGLIKVGHSMDVKKRIKGYGPTAPAQLLAVHPGSRSDEAGLHQQFTPWRKAGREWYEPSAAIMRHISEVVTKHGDPPDFRGRPWIDDGKRRAVRLTRG